MVLRSFWDSIRPTFKDIFSTSVLSFILLFSYLSVCISKESLPPYQQLKILITGANGWIGYNAWVALKKYQLVLVDNKVGIDSNNRFGIENTDQATIAGSQMVIIDLASDSGRVKFEELLKEEKPDCVLHLAGILENRNVKDIEKNNIITRNVLDICASMQINLIASSSIMVMYGIAVKNKTIKEILFGNPETKPDQQLTVDTELENSEETTLSFEQEKYQQYWAYIRAKEYLELYAKKLVDKNPKQTIMIVRFGWTGIKNPFELEKNTTFKESTVYLAQEDLQDFLNKVVDAVVAGNIRGYKKYIAVSEHPQRWAEVKNAENDLNWKPRINIIDKYVS